LAPPSAMAEEVEHRPLRFNGLFESLLDQEAFFSSQKRGFRDPLPERLMSMKRCLASDLLLLIGVGIFLPVREYIPFRRIGAFLKLSFFSPLCAEQALPFPPIELSPVVPGEIFKCGLSLFSIAAEAASRST